MRKRQKTIQVVGAAILKDGRCLATQRSERMANPLEWEFPGGKVELGEDPRKALAREIREELAVEIIVGEPLGSGISHQDGHTIHLEVYTAALLGGCISLAEHRSYGWFTSDEVDSLTWSSADLPLLDPLKRHLSCI